MCPHNDERMCPACEEAWLEEEGARLDAMLWADRNEGNDE